MTELDHKYNALLAMDYWLISHEKLVDNWDKQNLKNEVTEHFKNYVSEMRASRKFIEENR